MGRRWATCDADALPDWHLAITWKSSPSSRHMYNMPTLVLPLRPYRGTYISYYCMCRCLVSWVWMNSSGGISMYLRAISPRKKPKKGGRVHWSARQLADTNAEAAEAAAISIFNLLTHDINRPMLREMCAMKLQLANWTELSYAICVSHQNQFKH